MKFCTEFKVTKTITKKCMNSCVVLQVFILPVDVDKVICDVEESSDWSKAVAEDRAADEREVEADTGRFSFTVCFVDTVDCSVDTGDCSVGSGDCSVDTCDCSVDTGI